MLELVNALNFRELRDGIAPYLSRSRGYTRSGATNYSLIIPDPARPGYASARYHRFSAWSDAEAQEHAQAYLAKQARS